MGGRTPAVAKLRTPHRWWRILQMPSRWLKSLVLPVGKNLFQNRWVKWPTTPQPILLTLLCPQVITWANTDIAVHPHGASVTLAIFMPWGGWFLEMCSSCDNHRYFAYIFRVLLLIHFELKSWIQQYGIAESRGLQMRWLGQCNRWCKVYIPPKDLKPACPYDMNIGWVLKQLSEAISKLQKNEPRCK